MVKTRFHIGDIPARQGRIAGTIRRPIEGLVNEETLARRRHDRPVQGLCDPIRIVQLGGSAIGRIVDRPIAGIVACHAAAPSAHPDAAIATMEEVMHIIGRQGGIAAVVHRPIVVKQACDAIVGRHPERATDPQDIAYIVAGNAGIGGCELLQIGNDRAHLCAHPSTIDPCLVLIADAIHARGAGRARAAAIHGRLSLIEQAVGTSFLLFTMGKQDRAAE